MMAELGQLLLCLALVLSLIGTLPRRWLPPDVGWTSTLAMLQSLCLAAAMACLVTLFVDVDLTVSLVAQHATLAQPLIYRIAAAWGQHEGSMLLWALVVAGYGAAWCRAHPSHPLTHPAMRMQSALLAGTLLFILLTSNPFERLLLVPQDGQGLNPLLQDLGLAMHPPLLYLGYVGLALVFSLSVAGMRTGRLDADWAKLVRPWILIPWSALTFGIGLGAWWAYRELGWGGWWFWDPVENASFVPWLVATALFHSLIVLEKRGLFARWVALLACLGFAASLIGTFLVRSGLLTSVHAFASDPTRGLFILGFVALSVGFALWNYARFALLPSPQASVPLLSRTNALLLNNLLLCTMAATVLTGILYPVILPLVAGTTISVGPAYYLATVVPLAGLALLLGGAATSLSWQGGLTRRGKLILALGALFILGLLVFLRLPLTLFLTLACGVWMAFGALASWRNHGRTRRGQGMILAHLGLGMFVAAAGINHHFKRDYMAMLTTGSTAELGPYQARILSHNTHDGENYRATRYQVELTHPGLPPLRLEPEQRRYTGNQSTDEAAIAIHPARDWYLVAHADEAGLELRLTIEPGILWIWSGIALMALGGVWSALAPRRISSPNADRAAC